MSNVINFPVAMKIKQLNWYGGRSFVTRDEVKDAMSDKDWRRVRQWQHRHAARVDAETEKQGGSAA